MDFGKIDEKELDTIDFTLPPDPAGTKEVLSKGKGKTKFFIGCAKWGRKDWIGKLYPPGTKEKDFLEYYARQFNCIEFNATFYKSPGVADVEKWKSKVPKKFLFFPKFPQTITHLKRLKNVDHELDAFLNALAAFKENLGPIFLMPHPQLGPKHIEQLETFITRFPKDVALYTELRHPDWYTGQEGYDAAFFEFLRKHKRGTIITDAAGRRDCVHMHLSTPDCFIRFVGNSLHRTDYERVDDWVNRIKDWMDAGLENCYFFMHQHEELHSPELIKYLIEQLNSVCKTHIKPPVMNMGTGDLFSM
ncbi:MAG TPA: DUF72 domain-containing protein [Flavipsychrobacter sp.]|nr:DUF72 domain-containing protein [Flavipsychrobacter sp.]